MKFNLTDYKAVPLFHLCCLIALIFTILIQPYYDSVPYKAPDPSKVKSCIQKRLTEIPDLNNVLPLWCQITANEDKPIPVVLTELTEDINAGVESGVSSASVLKIHPKIVQYSQPTLYFILGHEYHHYRAHHFGFRFVSDVSVLASITALIVWTLVWIYRKEIYQKEYILSVLSSFVITVCTYNLAYWSFKQNELASDRGSVRVLRAIKIDPVSSFEAYDQFSRTVLVRSEPNNRYSCFLDFKDEKPLSIYNCNPHPTIEVRANKIQPYLKK